MSVATSKPAAYHCPATRWSLDDIATALHHHASGRAMRRSTIWRSLDAAALQPHRRVSWLNSHDPACALQARASCDLYVHALRFDQQDRLVIGTDAKAGRQIRQRKAPPPLPQPGQPEKREQE
jgi:hypothetical protein